MKMHYTMSAAVISQCGAFRYSLTRQWDARRKKIMFLMLNPSTANGMQDDPTIRRCVNFAESWGYGGIIVGNLFAFRSKSPDDLLYADDPIGPDNIDHLQNMARVCDVIVCAWGNSRIIRRMELIRPDYKPLQALENLAFIKLNGDGTPAHPLYIHSNAKFQLYKP
jgi:hypothetical protein